MHREWKITAGRRLQTYDHKINPVHRSSLLRDPICPIKKLLLADAFSACFFMEGHRGKRQRHVFSCTRKEGVEST